MNTVYLSLGSNQKSPIRQLRHALLAIKAMPHTSIIAVSSFYWTKAWGLHTQQDFCNIVIKLITSLPPHRLLRQCQKIEKNQGRVRKKRWGPRTLDIDILLYGGRTIHTKSLIIPHPQMLSRDFVMKPLTEIYPNRNIVIQSQDRLNLLLKDEIEVTMYQNILYATDLTSQHSGLTEKAIAIAKHFNAKLYLLHVIELPASIQIAQGLGFTELANPAKDDAQTVLSLIGERYNIPPDQQFVEIGSVKEHIFNKVNELKCQLILIGSHSSSGLSSILGSTAHATVNHAPCDVLTLRV